MAALLYLIDTLLSLVQLCFLLRLLLQWARADFRNPLLRAIVQLTSPVLVPLRRVLPAIGRLDTASVVVVIALALLRVSMGTLLSGLGLPPWLLLIEVATLQLAAPAAVDLFLCDLSLRHPVVHRAGHLFTRAGSAERRCASRYCGRSAGLSRHWPTSIFRRSGREFSSRRC